MKTSNIDHNIYNNNGTLWVRFTVHYPDYTAGRVAKSLNTTDMAEARRRRDDIMKSTPGARIPVLVLPRPEARTAPLAMAA